LGIAEPLLSIPSWRPSRASIASASASIRLICSSMVPAVRLASSGALAFTLVSSGSISHIINAV
jgi:hypothetical protein